MSVTHMTSTRNVHVIKLAQNFRTKLLTAHVRKEDFDIVRTHDGYIVRKGAHYAVVYPHGICCEWGSTIVIDMLRAGLEDIAYNVFKEPCVQTFNYKITDNIFTIEDEDILSEAPIDDATLLALSDAFAMSVQIEYQEHRIHEVFEQTQVIPRQLQENGRIKLKKKALKKMIGRIVEAQHSLSYYSMADDLPEALWEHHEHQHVYKQLVKYLEIKDRQMVVSSQIDTLHTTLDVIRDEVNTHNSHFLEVVIIALIVLEVFFYIIELI